MGRSSFPRQGEMPGSRRQRVWRLLIQLINGVGRRRDGFQNPFCIWFWNWIPQGVISITSAVQTARWCSKASWVRDDRCIRCVFVIVNTEVIFVVPKYRRVIRVLLRSSFFPHRLMFDTNIRWVCDFNLYESGIFCIRFHTQKPQ